MIKSPEPDIAGKSASHSSISDQIRSDFVFNIDKTNSNCLQHRKLYNKSKTKKPHYIHVLSFVKKNPSKY